MRHPIGLQILNATRYFFTSLVAVTSCNIFNVARVANVTFDAFEVAVRDSNRGIHDSRLSGYWVVVWGRQLGI